MRIMIKMKKQQHLVEAQDQVQLTSMPSHLARPDVDTGRTLLPIIYVQACRSIFAGQQGCETDTKLMRVPLMPEALGCESSQRHPSIMQKDTIT